jgi:hypothetical protein
MQMSLRFAAGAVLVLTTGAVSFAQHYTPTGTPTGIIANSSETGFSLAPEARSAIWPRCLQS